MPDQGLLAVAFFEASAILIPLVLYLFLQRNFTQRFFRFWVVGWILYALFVAGQMLCRWRGISPDYAPLPELWLAGALCLGAAVLEYMGHGRRATPQWVLGVTAVVAIVLRVVGLADATVAQWTRAVLDSLIYLAAGWLLLRQAWKRRGYGNTLLGAALFLRGLHSADQTGWGAQAVYLLRVSFDGLLGLALGVAMVVLLLEASRTRAEDLNEKLRRLTLLTTAATQTFKVDEVLREVLNHLVGSLRASHGLVRLLDGEGDAAALVLRASVGFDAGYLEQNTRVPLSQPWARRVLEDDAPFLAYANVPDPAIPSWMQSEKLSALVLVRLPGKAATLGVLGIGSAGPRVFHSDEVNFLVNVANLLGLTIQNVWFFEQAAEARRQWLCTFDSIGDPILVHDYSFRVLRVNRAVAEMLSQAPAALIGRPLREVLRRGETRWNQCPYCEGAAGTADAFDPTFNGYLLASTSSYDDPLGKSLGTIHVLTDITAHKKAEEKYRKLFENVQEGVFISTPDGRFVDFNDAFLRMTGYRTREELLQADIAAQFYVDQADRERLKRLLREHGSVSNFEFQMRRRDGEIRTVTESSVATYDASGDVLAFQGFVLDVTERKLAEQEIRRRNRELMVLNSIALTLSQPLELDHLLARALRQVVELFGADLSAIYFVDEETGVVERRAAVGFRSEYARRFPPTAFPRELLEHIRKARAALLAPQSLPLPPIFQDLNEKEGVVVSHLVVLWSKDRILGGLAISARTEREFSAAELNLLTAVGNQIAATVEKSLLYEETRRAYHDLRRTQEQLLQSEKMAAVGQLISGVAHELNNPLTAILGYSQLLTGSDHVSPRGAEYVNKLYKQAQRTHRIVQNLLSFARQQKPERLPVPVNQVLEDTIILREYDLRLNNIRVHRQFDPQLPATSGDRHQLQQVFLNILNNAVDAVLERGDQGDIWVHTMPANGTLVVEFTDSGPGVREPLRVFDPFYTTKPVGKGTGLGLSICYGIVKEHGGEISVRNSPPRGATFTITLPVLPVSPGEAPEALPREPALPCGRVLLVDDEEAVLDLERELLTGQCRWVKGVHSGREALEILAREKVDVVVTDLKMPGDVSGHDIYRWIERYRPDLLSRVIFTMSDARNENVRAFLQQTGCCYVQKPFTVEDFLRVVWGVLEQIRPAGVTR